MVKGFVLAAVACLAAWGCRASNPQEPESALNDTAVRLLFAADGSAAPCDAPAKSCPNFQDDKDFVDVCVDKGFQARSCGCVMRCTGKVDFVSKAPADLAATSKPEPTPGATCSPGKSKEVDAILASRHPGGALDRCLDTHLCNGMLGGCDDDVLKTSKRLRELGRTGCEDEVVGNGCKDGFVDSLSCPESDIALLSKTWSDFRNKDVPLKRCLRKVVCSGDRGDCSAENYKQALAVKAGVDRDGCEYWLRQFCSLGGSAW